MSFMIIHTATNIIDRPVRRSSPRVLLVITMIVALLGVAQLDVSHIHIADHAVECELHAAGPLLDAAISHAVDWFLLFALAPLSMVVSASQSAANFPHFLTRAPPVFHH